jgi:hypothetical protein
LESSIRIFTVDYLGKLFLEKNATFFIESNIELDIPSTVNNLYSVNFSSPQTSFLPIFLKNIANYKKFCKEENYYVIVDNKKFIGYVKFKLNN